MNGHEMKKRIKLWPVADAAGVIPFLWRDSGKRECLYMAEMHNREIVFGHESGYGFLRRCDVLLMRTPCCRTYRGA